MDKIATPEEKFDEAFQVADEAREKMLAFFDGVSQEDSERRASSDEWSIGEIAHHLLLVEDRYCNQFLATITRAQEGEFSEQEVIAQRPFPLEDAADVTKSGKGKAPEPTQPSHGLAIKELCEQLRQHRQETQSKLMPYRTRDLGNLWYQHPRLGPMTLYEQIRLLGYHDLKHLAQSKRLVS
ncbi:DinB family protein [Acidobacteria bacterium AH-259-D05]|nr:DinB family protein [Acidobacteria bacterium AH-259-D05]